MLAGPRPSGRPALTAPAKAAPGPDGAVSPPRADGGADAGAEQSLLHAAERAVRQAQTAARRGTRTLGGQTLGVPGPDSLLAASPAPGRSALVLHLSGLRPPAPRPHHLRVARAILQDAAARQDGQVFALRSGDMVLLHRTPAAPAEPARPVASRPGAARGLADAPTARMPTALVDVLARLFRVDVPDPASLVSVWDLQHEAMRLLDYARDRSTEAAASAAGGGAGVVRREPPPPPADSIDRVAAVVAGGRITDLMHRQTAVALNPRAASDSQKLQPLFREIMFSIPALQARVAVAGAAQTDPFLFRHLAARLDQRMLEVLLLGIGQDGPLQLRQFAGARPALHLNMTIAGILSPVFARFAAAVRENGANVGIEVALIEACADPAGYARAREALAAAGLSAVLDGIGHLALHMTDPAALGADLYKLEWSPRLADLAADRLDLALQRLDPRRIVLYRAETEAALAWALTHGIRRVQGRHIDAMLGAGRIVGCALAAECTLPQCIERAAALGAAGRIGCGNPAMLDAGTLPAGAAPAGAAPAGVLSAGVSPAPARQAAPRQAVA